jgi:hypothetical protein
VNRRSLAVRAVAALTAAAAFALVAGRNGAQTNDVNIQFHSFQDTRGVTVLSPTVDFDRDFTDRTALRASFGVDAISAASDSCARCHRDGISSRRQVVGASVTRKYADMKLTFGGAFSLENFYRSTTGLMSATRNFAKGNTTVAGGFSFSLNQPMLHPLPDRENQYASDGYVSVTQTLSKTTIVQGGYELAHISGYQDNPFLRANVNGIMVVGRVPDARTRNTLTARVRQALPADTYVEADYRRYFDDWQIDSNTVSVGLSHYLSREWLLNVSYRYYDQTAAYFYEPVYVGVPTYFTADFRLTPFASNDYIARVIVTPHRQLLGLPTGTGLTVQYERYRADNGFDAAILSTGVQVPLKKP